MSLSRKILLILPFILMVIVNFFLPQEYIWDERLFLPTAKSIGQNYIPSIEQIRSLNSPMGPIYFIIWGFIGRVLSYNLMLMRLVHIGFSISLVLLIYRLLEHSKINYFLPLLLFIYFPYFLVMTGPLLYTDVTAMLFLFAGLFVFYVKDNRLIAAIFFGLAICTRQLFIIIPMAIGIVDLINLYRGKSKWIYIMTDVIPLLMFLPLFFLWGYNVNSGSYNGSQFEEASLAAFSFSIRKVNYIFLFVGTASMPFFLRHIRKLQFYNNIPLWIISSLLLVIGFPVYINKGLKFGKLPDTAGLLDIGISSLSFLKYLFVSILFYISLNILIKIISLKANDHFVAFCKASLILSILLESIYSYCWDKHFIVILPLLFYLASSTAEGRIRDISLNP